MNDQILVRMPPSPTGHLHLGTARSALFNWLFAKKNSGKIIFRWEDTDKERSKTEHETEILEGLKWLGMDFVENGDGFYRQTENTGTHQDHLKKLWDEEKVFPCFSTVEEIDAMREEAAKKKTNFVFWSPFRDLDKKSAEKKMETEPFVWRFKTPKDKWIEFKDLVRKKISVNSDTLGDFSVARSDGSVLYMLANVVDDATQGVTHVIRGEDHISNTPKQILLYLALDYKVPRFGHLPLVLDKNKRKLSKRNVEPGVAVLISDFQKQGFIPEGVVNGLVFLGWNPKSTQEMFSFAELSNIFEIANVNPGGAQYDFDKMIWFNAKWIRQIDLELLQKYYADFSGETVDTKFLNVAREKAKTLVELQDELQYLIHDPELNEALLANERFGLDISTAKQTLAEIYDMITKISAENFDKQTLREKSIEKIAEMGLKNGEFLWPFRIALANREGSAGPFEIAEALGKEETLKRIERAKN